jgi:hypothetical protein
MTVATNAILVYGFEVPHDDDQQEKRVVDFLSKREGDTARAYEERHGISVVEHCSLGEQMFIVGLTSSLTTAWRGYPRSIGPTRLARLNRARADARLAQGAKRIGIRAKPGQWLLCSMWESAD